jgi:hypothetical protein
MARYAFSAEEDVDFFFSFLRRVPCTETGSFDFLMHFSLIYCPERLTFVFSD